MVQIRNVPDELLHELKARAAAQRMSLSDFLLARLAEIAEEPALDDVLDRLAALPRRDLARAQPSLLTRLDLSDRVGRLGGVELMLTTRRVRRSPGACGAKPCTPLHISMSR